ncbi:hypothetical protein [Aquincola tertiaricarbonis]|uniref:hypothetical protein n=1 Tax=Aquincola tertiaricarbonis TaxID=391953 RepID=UPI001E5069BC|nr:hypothetical protein [Aquincola tertiaricarbonis]
MAFEDKYLQTVVGTIVRINDRTASIDPGDGNKWRVGFGLLATSLTSDQKQPRPSRAWWGALTVQAQCLSDSTHRDSLVGHRLGLQKAASLGPVKGSLARHLHRPRSR